MLSIERAADMDEVREILREYAQETGLDLAWQNFARELETLPADYDPLLVARWNGALAGCGALHDLGNGICEMKRLFVRPQFRGHRIARTLAETLIAAARERGYRAMRLDTLPMMTAAMALYESLGFVDIEPYVFNPIEKSRYMELTLAV
jgi:putative acetyltransferase